MAVKSVTVRLLGEDSSLRRALRGSAADAAILDRNLEKADKSGHRLNDTLNTSNDRTTMLVQGALALGPALVPLGAQAVPIVMGLATQLGVAAGAAGTLALAFQGVFKSVGAVNEYAIDPTNANLEKMREEMAKLGPEGREFVRFLADLRPAMQDLQDIAQEQMFPGMTEGIEELLTLMPQVEEIVGKFASGIGQVSASAGRDLAGSDWASFFNYIEDEAKPILVDMMETLGNFANGFADLIVAFGPLTEDFSNGFRRMSEDFAQWSQNLSQTEGFASFVEYIEETGPQVADTLGSLAMALVEILEAAAPVGAATLPIIRTLADILAAIMNTPAGPVLVGVAAGLSAVSRAIALYNVANGSALMGFLGGAETKGAKAGAALRIGAAGVAALALSMTDLDNKMGINNTAMLASLGLMAGGPGAIAGGLIGLTMDAAAANDSLVAATEAATDAIRTQNEAVMELARSNLLAQIAESTDKGFIDSLGAVAEMDWSKLWEAGPSMGAAREGMGQFTESGQAAQSALEALDRAMNPIPPKADEIGWAARGMSEEFAGATENVLSLSAALTELNEWLSKRAAIRGYGDDLETLATSVKEGFSQEMVENLDATAASIAKVAENIKGKGAREDFLQGARESLRELAEGAGPKARAEIQKVIGKLDELGLTSPKPKVDTREVQRAKEEAANLERGLNNLGNINATPSITVEGAAAAGAAARSVETALNAIDDEMVYINVMTRRQGGNESGGLGPVGNADGGTIGGNRYPYKDKVLRYLAPGEEVISNRKGQADLFRPLLKEINQFGMAWGGTVPGWGGGGSDPLRMIRYIDPPDKRDKGQSLAEFRAEEIKELRAIHREVKSVIHAFAVDLDDGPGGVRKALRDFQKDLKEAGGAWTKGLEAQAEKIRDLAERYDTLNGRIEAQSAVVDQANAALSEMQSAAASFGSAVAGKFTTDLFGGGLTGMDKALSGDIAGRREFDALIQSLIGQGLDPKSDFFREIAASGDLRTARQLSAGGAGVIDYYEGQYATRAGLNTAAGAFASEASFGSDLRTAAAEAQKQTEILTSFQTRQTDLQKLTNARLQKIEDSLKGEGAEKIGQEVGKAVNSPATAASQTNGGGGGHGPHTSWGGHGWRR